MTGLLEQGSRQGQEESGQQKHQWTKQRLCVTYKISLETQDLQDKAWDCHISSSGLKYQQQRGALWIRQK